MNIKESRAERVLQAYNFDGYTVTGMDGWDASDRTDWMRIIYVEDPENNDEYSGSLRLSFHVRFAEPEHDPEDDPITEVYALRMDTGDCVGFAQTYNHLYEIAFSVGNSFDPDGYTTLDERVSALKKRVDNLLSCGEVIEASGLPSETYEEEPRDSNVAASPKHQHIFSCYNAIGLKSVTVDELAADENCVARLEQSGSEGYYVEVARWDDDAGWYRYAFNKFFDFDEAELIESLININSGMLPVFHKLPQLEQTQVKEHIAPQGRAKLYFDDGQHKLLYLVAEISKRGVISADNMAEIADAMDLTECELTELFDLAEAAREKAKAELCISPGM